MRGQRGLQSHQGTNLSCRHRVNSRHAKRPPSPSQTSRTYQRFSGNCTEPRRTRKNIPHGRAGAREQMGFITALLPALDWADFSTIRGHGYGTPHLQSWQTRGPSSPRCPTLLLTNALHFERCVHAPAASQEPEPGKTAPRRKQTKQKHSRKTNAISEGFLDFTPLPTLAVVAGAQAAQPCLSGGRPPLTLAMPEFQPQNTFKQWGGTEV